MSGPSSLTAATLDKAFALIEAAAVARKRAPTNRYHDNNGEHGDLPSGATNFLVRQGRIKVEIYGRNFRRITILTGPNAGARTAAPPDPTARPYKVLEQVGTTENTRSRARLQPSPPRLLGA